MPNILGIGESALNAAQIGLATTGHNIANASTPGYNRQLVVQGTLGGQDLGGGFVGKGTEVVAVRRVYNEFLQSQLQTSQTAKGQLETYYKQMTLVDNLMSDSTVGISPALQEFFSGVQGMASDPSSAAARQTLLSDAQSMTSRFQALDSQLTEIRQGVNAQIVNTMDQVNTLSKQVGDLNTQIERALRNSNGQPPNDLLDQRDQVITELSQLVKVSMVKQGSSYDVYIGNGQPMVVGTRTYQLVQMQSPTDSGRIEIGYQNQQGVTMLDEGAFGGGVLGGLMKFRSQSLDVAQNNLGRMAIALGTAFNAQQQLGQDQNGNMGVPFFRVAQPLSTASTRNTGTGSVSAVITNASQLTTSDYQVEIMQEEVLPATPLQYRITRLSDGQTFNSDQLDGLELSFDGALKTGDQFLIRPTVNGAHANLGLAVAINDKNQIAAAAPIRTIATTTNTGTGTVSEGKVNPGLPVDPDLRTGVTITFTSPTTYTVTGSGANLPQPPANEFTYTSGADISYNGWTMQIGGAPAVGDSFTVGANTSGAGDGRNALALGKLQTTALVEGTMTVQSAYSSLVNFVGNQTKQLEVTSESATKLAALAQSTRDAESGVNLDEEAANLLRYQQAYQAAGKVMQTAQQMFEMLLTLGS
jgi:flagellar hook-associated protein 1 FlgK